MFKLIVAACLIRFCIPGNCFNLYRLSDECFRRVWGIWLCIFVFCVTVSGWVGWSCFGWVVRPMPGPTAQVLARFFLVFSLFGFMVPLWTGHPASTFHSGLTALC